MKDKNGHTVAEEEKTLERWREYFRQLMDSNLREENKEQIVIQQKR